MKAKLTGSVTCLECNHTCQPKDLKEKQDGQLVKCPNCDYTLMDFTNGNFIIDKIKAEKMDVTI